MAFTHRTDSIVIAVLIALAAASVPLTMVSLISLPIFSILETVHFVLSLENTEDTGRLADSIASNMPLKLLDKQKVLDIENTRERAEFLLELLLREIQIAEVDTNIDRKVKKNIDKTAPAYAKSV